MAVSQTAFHMDDRKNIDEWRNQCLQRKTKVNHLTTFFFHKCSLTTLRVFFKGINFMVIVQMILACAAVYLCKIFHLTIASDAALIVSPVIFPLAFAINTDFQRREKVLEHLGNFKATSMVCYLCMRDWQKECGLDDKWLMKVDSRFKSIVSNIREYLLSSRSERRIIIVSAIYKDLNDINRMFAIMRTANLPLNAPLISRLIQLLSEMCAAFERLQCLREYRSSRTIRSFNKVMILLLPVILSPYFQYLGEKSGNQWSPFYMAIVVAFIFSALQGVQDKLDDPFDNIGEDDINLDYLEEWMCKDLHINSETALVTQKLETICYQMELSLL